MVEGEGGNVRKEVRGKDVSKQNAVEGETVMRGVSFDVRTSMSLKNINILTFNWTMWTRGADVCKLVTLKWILS